MLKTLSLLAASAALAGCVAVPVDQVYVAPTPVYVSPPVIYSPPVYRPYYRYHYRPRVYRHGSWIY